MTKVVHDTDVDLVTLDISTGKLKANDSMATDAELDAQNKSLRGLDSHLRLSKNAILEPNAAGTAPKDWAMGDIYSAIVEEYVQNEVDPATRSPLAQEFLNALKSNQMYFQSPFYIWRMKIRVPAGSTSAIPMYQRVNTSSGECTLGCVIKHISGMLPKGAMFNGTQPAPAGAQLIINSNAVWGGGRHHSYSMMHGYFFGNPGDEAEFLIALPAIVTGYVCAEDGWGNFPYLNQTES